jgi:serine/threonine protein kinase
MGKVFLCEHLMLRRQVAIKVLPRSRTDNPMHVERFYREARAVAALDHPNIVRCFDVDRDGPSHFMVMEYVDGQSLDAITSRRGPMEPLRAAHYIRQAALGLQHAHEAGWVHRDIKPANILLDRTGTVKLLDLGLARLFHDQADNLTQQFHERAVLGTADYIAPEQALASHDVDIRADIYSLGATAYFLLTGRVLFPEGSITQKLIWHQMREPQPIAELRPEVPEALIAVVCKMMAKAPVERYQTPVEVANALAPLTATPIPLPPEAEMVRPEVSVVGLGLSDTPSSGSGRLGMSAATGAPGGTLSRANAGTFSGSAGTTPPDEPAAFIERANAARSTPPRSEDRTRQTSRIRKPVLPDVPPTVQKRRLPDGRAVPTQGQVQLPEETPAPKPTAAAPTRGLRGLLLLLVLVGLAGAASAFYWLRPTSTQGTAAPTDPGSNPTTPAGREPLRVTRNRQSEWWGKPDTFESVREAVRHAKSGDRIVLLDQFYEERLALQGNDLPTDGVVIESATSQGEPTTWRLPADLTEDQPVLALSGVRGLRCRGIIFDGEQRVSDLVALGGSCPGLLFENVQLRGFTASGLKLTSCSGSAAAPVTFRRVRATGGKDTDCAVSIGLAPGGDGKHPSQHLVFSDCRFEGPYAAAVRVRSPAVAAEFVRNRFFRAQAAFDYGPTTAGELELAVTSNTFCDVAVVFALEKLEPDSRVTVRDNLFVRCPRFVKPGAGITTEQVAALFRDGRGNVREKASVRDTPTSVAVRQMDVALSVEPGDDRKFLRYAKASALTTAGSERGPVGVPPE